MKWETEVDPGPSGVRRIELVETGTGAFLYLYDVRNRSSRVGEEWYESAMAARAACDRRFGVTADHWKAVP